MSELTQPALARDVVVDLRVDDEKAGELVDALRPRLASVAGEEDISRLVREALDELAPVRIYNYLPVLVERRVRDRIRLEHPPV
jgi:Protein of unknown function (DUF3562)